jgi:hypothetical protein
MQIGKTEFLIAELLESVLDGQPRSIVVGHTERYARELQHRVAAAMRGRHGFGSIALHQGRITLDGDQTIEFMGVTKATRTQTVCGRRGAGWFWDHAVFDHYPDYLSSLPHLQQAIIRADLASGGVANGKQLAERFGSSVGSIEVSRHKAKEKIRTELTKLGHFNPSSKQR